MRLGLQLFAAHEGLGMFDAVLAATVLGSTRLSSLLSADRGFAAVPDLAYRSPVPG